MSLHFDIWQEVVQHFDNVGSVGDPLPRPDRRALLRLALSSHSLSLVALPALWKACSSLRPIFSIINTFSKPKDPFLAVDTNGDVQVLCMPLTEAARCRANQYLSYIRSFRTGLYPNHPTAPLLWRELSALLGKCGTVLLPNLQVLEIMAELKQDMLIDTLSFIVTPTIQSLSIIAGGRHLAWPSAYKILDAISGTAPRVRFLSYDGKLDEHLCSSLLNFRELSSLETRLHVLRHRPWHNSPLSVAEFLTSFPNLLDYSCTLNHWRVSYSSETSRSLASRQHLRLRSLSIDGSSVEIISLFTGLRFPSLDALSLICDSFATSCWKTIAELIVLHCPRVTRLLIHSSGPFPFSDSNHYAPLLSLPLRNFDLAGEGIVLTLKDFESITNSWTNLTSLSIRSRKQRINALDSLVPLSRLPHLRTLFLGPMQFRTLASPTDFISHSSRTPLDLGYRSPLVEFKIQEIGRYDFPSEEGDLENIGKHLLLLFPRIQLGYSLALPRHISLEDTVGFKKIVDTIRRLRERRPVGHAGRRKTLKISRMFSFSSLSSLGRLSIGSERRK